jgi:glycerophosphoryl diester phosphodiesterase
MWQIAHRGSSHKYGDNNMTAFRKAYEEGFNMIELDVQLCFSGQIVVYHDINIGDKYIIDMTYDDLKQHDVVLLEDVFAEFCYKDIMLFLDIKGSHAVAYPLIRLIEKWFSVSSMNRIYISGFNRLFVDIVASYNYHIQIGFTSNNMFSIEQIDTLVSHCGFVCLHWTALEPFLIEHLQKKHIKVFSYTCENEFSLKHMLQYNLDGIVSNHFINDLS